MHQEDKNRGLHSKYEIRRTDNKPIPREAKFFILRYDREKDRAAKEALRTYAKEIQKECPELAQDLLVAIEKRVIDETDKTEDREEKIL